MHNFCTLFDSFYLTRGITMYQSLERTCDNFHLYIFAFDDVCFDILSKLKLKQATIIPLKDFEDEELLKVKPTRTKAEYCWTSKSATLLYVFDNYQVPSCTYIEADLYFYQNPNLLFDEMKDKSVLITAHRYTQKYDRSKIAGIYCVQFITFLNNEEGLAVLKWWKKACFDWCYDQYEDGKFGDQKYLDDWTTRFKGVHSLQHLGGGLAPWNVQQYNLIDQTTNDIKLVNKSDSTQFSAIFYHFHYVRFYSNQWVDLGWFKLKRAIVNGFYSNYIRELRSTLQMVQKIEPSFKEGLRPFSLGQAKGLKNKLKFLIKYITRYNVFKIAYFLNK